jgi:hypothetical protein
VPIVRQETDDLSNGCQAIAQLPSSRNRRIVRLEANDEVVGDSYVLTFSD